jgi:hypothetical protein
MTSRRLPSAPSLTFGRALGLALVLALGVSACATGPSPSPLPEPSGSATATSAAASAAADPASPPAVSASAQPSSMPSAPLPDHTLPATNDSPEPSSGPIAPHGAADLERLLPDQVGSLEFAKASYTGEQLTSPGVPTNAKTLDALLASTGKTRDDVHLAVANASGTGESLGVLLYAIRIDGLSAEQVETGLGFAPESLKPEVIGGRPVEVSTAGTAMIVVRSGAILIVALGVPAAELDALVRALP